MTILHIIAPEENVFLSHLDHTSKQTIIGLPNNIIQPKTKYKSINNIK